MAVDRMSKDEFYEKLDALDEARLKKALWNLYWRGTASVRERIEDAVTTDPARQAKPQESINPAQTLRQVREFCKLARAGAFLGASGHGVRAKRRSNWRHEFRGLVKAARTAMAETDPGPGMSAMEEIIDLAVYSNTYEVFTSQEPLEVAKFVVSDEVEALWRRMIEHRGFAAFTAVGAEQLLRWEAKYGWTQSGWGPIAEQERQLADVLVLLLPGIDQWLTFTEAYVAALDSVPLEKNMVFSSSGVDWPRRKRTENLSAWHLRLGERLGGSDEGAALLDRIVAHSSLTRTGEFPPRRGHP
ncbi:hypothetical protein [Glycomyces tarimensis]